MIINKAYKFRMYPNEYQKELINNKIYCPIIWPRSNYIDTKYSNTEYIYEHILCIPCDQRYNIQDMKKIINCITKI